ncbi:benzoate 4-monooxygenase cytochrome-like protein P450 [Aspergillus ellipticus CBS 707.79]|uniref:Benzoate 4-monooxygenase cytochrome-like protein P450 n=1 Tax=Aspergillus ellipticus CBS 707.79 TaxID=1448320 RepID=A0A319CXV6_9EURO|nr:benzoate 4-monooxygenase cytochrome-like protein P450 [Aspergillus ellipticus CBS 707.79]
MLKELIIALLGIAPLGSLLIFLLFAAFAIYIVYQTQFHPLAAYPGPFLAKLTNLYSVVHAFRADRHEDLYQLHQYYRRIVRIGPQRLSILDAQALAPIYGFQAMCKSLSGTTGSTALRGIEPHILSAIRDWCAALGDQHPDQLSPVAPSKSVGWSRPKNMAHWCAYGIFDILGEVCFGKTFNTSLRDANHLFFPLMALNVQIINICGQMPILRRLGFDDYLRMGTAADREQQIAFSRKQLGARLTGNPTQRRDIIYYLEQARDPQTGEGYNRGELISEATMLLGAGIDTANTALTATFYFLAHHPAILHRLTSAIRTAFPTLEDIVSGPRLTQLTYLYACVEESMRLCPPVPMDLPREVLPGGLQVGSWHFPAGTIVGVPTYSLHHSEEYFDRPFVYDPSRWLLRASEGGEGVDTAVLRRQRKAFIPFSLGPRAFIGRDMAMLEVEVSLARALWLYDMRLAPGTEMLGVGKEGEYKIKDHFVVGKEGPVLQFRAR